MRDKKLTCTLTATLLTLAATAAYAQAIALTATIPFAFRAVGADFPAGRYKVVPKWGASGSRGTMELQNVDTGKSVFIPSKVPLTGAKDERPRLTFQCRDGEGCSLAKLWQGSGEGLEFVTPPPTASQKERLETVYLDRVKGK